MKAHEIHPYGFVYTGIADITTPKITSKIGFCAQELKAREYQIRTNQKEPHPNYKMIGYLTLYNTTDAQLEHVEGEIRAKMEKYANHVGHDYFTYKAKKGISKKMAYKAFAVIAMAYGIECCEREGYEYHLSWIK